MRRRSKSSIKKRRSSSATFWTAVARREPRHRFRAHAGLLHPGNFRTGESGAKATAVQTLRAGRKLPNFEERLNCGVFTAAFARTEDSLHPEIFRPGEKRWRATALQDARARFGGGRRARSVLECASPLALFGAATTQRTWASPVQRQNLCKKPGQQKFPKRRQERHGLRGNDMPLLRSFILWRTWATKMPHLRCCKRAKNARQPRDDGIGFSHKKQLDACSLCRRTSFGIFQRIMVWTTFCARRSL